MAEDFPALLEDIRKSNMSKAEEIKRNSHPDTEKLQYTKEKRSQKQFL